MSKTTNPSWSLDQLAPGMRTAALVLALALPVPIVLWSDQWQNVVRVALLIAWTVAAVAVLNRLADLSPPWLAALTAVVLGSTVVLTYGVVGESPSGLAILAMNAMLMGSVAFGFRVVRGAVSWRPARAKG